MWAFWGWVVSRRSWGRRGEMELVRGVVLYGMLLSGTHHGCRIVCAGDGYSASCAS